MPFVETISPRTFLFLPDVMKVVWRRGKDVGKDSSLGRRDKSMETIEIRSKNLGETSGYQRRVTVKPLSDARWRGEERVGDRKTLERRREREREGERDVGCTSR